MTSPASSWSDDIFQALTAMDVRVAAYVPDAGHIRLINLCRAEPTIATVPLTTEEEGVALLAGAWLGGKRGVLLMQSSGVGNCINMLSLTRICAFPLLILATMRGEDGESNPWQVPMGRMTGDVLRLAGVDVVRADDRDRVGRIVADAGAKAFAESSAAAVLIGQQLIGFKSFGGDADSDDDNSQ